MTWGKKRVTPKDTAAIADRLDALVTDLAGVVDDLSAMLKVTAENESR